MRTVAAWGLIGYGNIGRELLRQMHQPGVATRLGLRAEPEFIGTSAGLMKADGSTPTGAASILELAELPEVVFVAIPSSDDGRVAYEYTTHILGHGKTVVTAEKGALANHFAALRKASDNFRRLGISATVGGGTRLLHVARQYCQDVDNITQIHLVLNGTLAAIMDWVAPLDGGGLPLEEAAARAVDSGYAEPGSDSAAAIIRGEAEGDIPKKLAIFVNSVGLSRQVLDWHDLQFKLSDQEIEQAVDPATPRRFIVSLYPLAYVRGPEFVPDDILGGFGVDHDGWRLVGGFRRVATSSLFSALSTLSGPDNGMVIGLGPQASDGVYVVTGPGAGVRPTVNAMLDDFVRLRSGGEN